MKIDKAKQMLGYEPAFTLAEGLLDTLEKSPGKQDGCHDEEATVAPSRARCESFSLCIHVLYIHSLSI